MYYSAYLFDLDGTLIDSAPDILAVANRVLHKLSLSPLSLHTLRGFIGDGFPVLIRRVINFSKGDPLDEEPKNQTEYKTALEFAEKAYLESPATHTILYPEVRESLEFLAKKAPLGLVTNKPYQVTKEVLKTLSLEQYFSVVVGADTLPVRKPSPKPLFFALETLEKEATESLFIGDHANDFLAAQRAGMSIALVSYGYTSEDALHALSPNYFLSSFGEVKTLRP